MGVSWVGGLGVCSLLCTGGPQVWQDNGWVAASVLTSSASAGAPQGCLFCWGEGLPSYPLPPSLLPASLGAGPYVQALINRTQGAELPAVFLRPDSLPVSGIWK